MVRRFTTSLLLTLAATSPLQVRAQSESAPPPPSAAPEAAPALETAPAAPIAAPAGREAPSPAPVTNPQAKPAAAPLPEAQPAPSAEPTPPAEPPTTAPPAEPDAQVAPVAQPVAETDDVSADEPESGVRWKASLTWDQLYNVHGFARGAQQTFNPTYEWLFVADAGYRLDPLTTLYARQDFGVELTDSDTTTAGQQLQLVDTVLEGWRTLIDDRPLDPQQQLVFSGRAGLELPLSRASQASGIVLGTRAQLRVAYAFEDVLHGLNTKAWLRYSHRWGGSDTVSAEHTFPCRTASFDGATSCSQLGRATVRDVIVFSTDAEILFAKQWGAGALVWLEWILTQPQPDGAIQIDTGSVDYDGAGSDSRSRRILDFWVRYKFNDWFGARAHMLNEFQEVGPTGRYRAPFKPIDTMVALELSISFDALYKSTQGHAVGD